MNRLKARRIMQGKVSAGCAGWEEGEGEGGEGERQGREGTEELL